MMDGTSIDTGIRASFDFSQPFDLDLWREEFERVWEGERAHSIETLLETVLPDHRDDLLFELLLVDIEFRKRKHDFASQSEYLARFPDSAETIAAAFSMTLRMTPLPRPLGEYILLEEIGQGGMGIVYKAKQRLLQNVVAVKTIREQYSRNHEAVTRFMREIHAMGVVRKVQHPSVVEVQYAGFADEVTPYLVMEFIEGKNVHAFAKEFFAANSDSLGSTSHIKLMTEIVLGAAEGLACIHLAGLVHRDIKPSNLMRATDGVVKILDLGLVKLRDPAPTHNETNMTNPGMLGTFHYMSPEQIEGAKDIDIRSDIYSLGLTFYWLINGKTKSDDSKPDIVLPAETQRIIDKMCTVKPRDRYQTPQELIDDLRRFLSPVEASDVATRTMALPFPFYRVVGTVMVGVICCSGIAFFYTNRPIQQSAGSSIASPIAIVTPPPYDRKAFQLKLEKLETARSLRRSGATDEAKEQLMRLEESLLKVSDTVPLEATMRDALLYEVRSTLADCDFFCGLASGRLPENMIRKMIERYTPAETVATKLVSLDVRLRQAVTMCFLTQTPETRLAARLVLDDAKIICDRDSASGYDVPLVPYRFAEAVFAATDQSPDWEPLHRFAERFERGSQLFSSQHCHLEYLLFALELLIRHDLATGNKRISDDMRMLDEVLSQPLSDPTTPHILRRYFDLAIKTTTPDDIGRQVRYIVRSRPVWGSGSSTPISLFSDDASLEATLVLFYFAPNDSSGIALYYPKEREQAKRFTIPISRQHIKKPEMLDSDTASLQLDAELVRRIRDDQASGRPILLSWDDSPCWNRRLDAITNADWPFDASLRLDEVIGAMK